MVFITIFVVAWHAYGKGMGRVHYGGKLLSLHVMTFQHLSV